MNIIHFLSILFLFIDCYSSEGISLNEKILYCFLPQKAKTIIRRIKENYSGGNSIINTYPIKRFINMIVYTVVLSKELTQQETQLLINSSPLMIYIAQDTTGLLLETYKKNKRVFTSLFQAGFEKLNFNFTIKQLNNTFTTFFHPKIKEDDFFKAISSLIKKGDLSLNILKLLENLEINDTYIIINTLFHLKSIDYRIENDYVNYEIMKLAQIDIDPKITNSQKFETLCKTNKEFLNQWVNITRQYNENIKKIIANSLQHAKDNFETFKEFLLLLEENSQNYKENEDIKVILFDKPAVLSYFKKYFTEFEQCANCQVRCEGQFDHFDQTYNGIACPSNAFYDLHDGSLRIRDKQHNHNLCPKQRCPKHVGDARTTASECQAFSRHKNNYTKIKHVIDYGKLEIGSFSKLTHKEFFDTETEEGKILFQFQKYKKFFFFEYLQFNETTKTYEIIDLKEQSINKDITNFYKMFLNIPEKTFIKFTDIRDSYINFLRNTKKTIFFQKVTVKTPLWQIKDWNLWDIKTHHTAKPFLFLLFPTIALVSIFSKYSKNANNSLSKIIIKNAMAAIGLHLLTYGGQKAYKIYSTIQKFPQLKETLEEVYETITNSVNINCYM